MRSNGALIDAALEINGTATIEEAFVALAERARALLCADTASVVSWDPQRLSGTIRAVAGAPVGHAGETVQPGNPVWDSPASGGATVTVLRTVLATGYSPQMTKLLEAMASSVSVPVLSADLAPITLQAAWRQPCTRAHLDSAVETLTRLAGLTRIAVRAHFELVRHAGLVVTDRVLEDVFEALPTAVGVSDPETMEILRVNRAMAELTGYSPEEMLGMTPPWPWIASADSVKGAGSAELLVRHKTGRLTPVEVKSVVVLNGMGEPAAQVALVTDLGERQRFEQQLMQSGKLASIGELAAGVAHEINNPLFAILGLVEFLIEDSPPESKQRERLEVIQSTGVEIRDIVRSLLDFARERSDVSATVSLAEVARQTVELFRRTSAAKQLEILERYPEEPTLVEASANQLKQIFVNLLSNARQAMPGGGTVVVEIAREGDHVVARIGDDGPGIPPETLARIFDPFYTTRRDVGGTGLGLSVSLGIAQSHGGTLTAQSQAGEGTEFLLSLPALVVQA
jgi:two-component system, NtrC family, sensor kinase